jgi:hypothetical protein
MTSLHSTIQRRAVGQSASTIETVDARISKTYTDSSGNVTGYDVTVIGQGAYPALVNVPNSSGLKMSSGDQCKLNFTKGSRHDPQVIGGSSTSSQTIGAAASAGQAAVLSAISAINSEPTSAAVLLPFPDTEAPYGYVLENGANTVFILDPGGEPVSGGFSTPSLTILFLPTLFDSLPDPTASLLPDGTLIEIRGTDPSTGAPSDTLYRLDRTLVPTAWRKVGGAGNSSSRITLALPSSQVVSPGYTYLLTADFSGSGAFEDECCTTTLNTDYGGCVVQRDEQSCTSSQQAWTIWVPASYPTYGYGYGRPLGFTLAAVKNVGWTGSGTSSVAASWTFTEIET